jgi:hypothetical protein
MDKTLVTQIECIPYYFVTKVSGIFLLEEEMVY